MTLLRVQACLERDTGLPVDRFCNTFYFVTPLPGPATAADLDEAEELVIQFYNAPAGTSNSVGQYMSSLLKAGQSHTVKIYDMTAPKPRPVIREAKFSIDFATKQPMPAEVAVCLSYKADSQPGVLPGRLRGRVYVGPLGVDSISSTINDGDVAPHAALMLALRDASILLLAAGGPPTAPTGLQWVVYSPTRAKASIITSTYVDNAFDTQRRRGGRATQRVGASK